MAFLDRNCGRYLLTLQHCAVKTVYDDESKCIKQTVKDYRPLCSVNMVTTVEEILMSDWSSEGRGDRRRTATVQNLLVFNEIKAGGPSDTFKRRFLCFIN